MRLSGLNAGLATFAVLIIINNVARNWSQVTNAASGISGLPDALFGVTLVAALVVVAIAWIFQQTATCLRLRGVRDDELAAASVGIHISKVRSAAFVLSAFLVGIGGGLFGQVQGAVTPDAFFLQPTFLAIAMLVVGGIGSLSGAVIGVLVITIMRELLTRLELGVTIGSFEVRAPFGVGNLAISIMMLAILIKRPVGLLAGRELLDPRGSSAPKSSGGHRRPAIEDSVNA
jgi:branched-chain amino acid transport system permease protein